MGSIARQDRGDRFIEEFKDRASEGISLGSAWTLADAGLEFTEPEEMVRMAYTFEGPGGARMTLYSEQPYFDPERDMEYELESVAGYLGYDADDPHELDALEARLRKAGLL